MDGTPCTPGCYQCALEEFEGGTIDPAQEIAKLRAQLATARDEAMEASISILQRRRETEFDPYTRDILDQLSSAIRAAKSKEKT